MLSNLPPGVSNSTYGAPWNDQLYIVSYHFASIFNSKDHGEFIMNSDQFKYELFMQGPTKYSYSTLYGCALDDIEYLFHDFLKTNNLTIIIDSVDEA